MFLQVCRCSTNILDREIFRELRENTRQPTRMRIFIVVCSKQVYK